MADSDSTKILKRARKMLVKYGWQQGGFGPEHEEHAPHCAIGAIRTAAHLVEVEDYYEAKFEAHRRLIQALPEDRWDNVVSYNDRYGRSKDEVISLFDKAIKMKPKN